MGGPDTPSIRPDTPDFWGMLWARECNFCLNYLRLHLVIGYFKIATHACILISLCIRIAAAAEEVVYEVVAEPQEPQGQAPQQEVRGESAQGPTHPSVEQQMQGKPQCTSY